MISGLRPYGGYVVEIRASSAPNPLIPGSGSGYIPREPDLPLLPEVAMILSAGSTAVTTLSAGIVYILSHQ